MQGLRDLRIWLAMSPAGEMPRKLEREMLLPLKEVPGKRIFKVRVSWTLKDSDDRIDDAISEAEGADDKHYEIIRQEDQDWGAGRLRLQNR